MKIYREEGRFIKQRKRIRKNKINNKKTINKVKNGIMESLLNNALIVEANPRLLK